MPSPGRHKLGPIPKRRKNVVPDESPPPKKTPNKKDPRGKATGGKTIRKGLNTKQPAGGSPGKAKKPHRFRSGTRALMEIRKAQRYTGLMTRSVLSYRHPPGADKSTTISAIGAGDCPGLQG